MLAVVEDQQHPAGAEPVGQGRQGLLPRALTDLGGGRDRPWDQLGLVQSGQVGEADAVGEAIGRLSGRLQRQARLAGATRAVEGDQATARHHPAEPPKLLRTADEGGGGPG